MCLMLGNKDRTLFKHERMKCRWIKGIRKGLRKAQWRRRRRRMCMCVRETKRKAASAPECKKKGGGGIPGTLRNWNCGSKICLCFVAQVPLLSCIQVLVSFNSINLAFEEMGAL